MPRTLLASMLALALTGCGESTASDGGPRPPRADAGGASTEGSGRPSRRRPLEAESRGREPTKVDRSEYSRAMIRGDAALKSGRFSVAKRHYLEAMELRPEKMAPALGALRSLRLRGHAEERAGVGRVIRKKLEHYWSNPETHPAAYMLSARLALALGKTGEALDRARLAAERLPEMGVAWRVLGEASMAGELWGEAVDAFRRATALGLQAIPGTWERMADALDELGELREAEVAARKALELTGTDEHAKRRRLNLLAVILKHRGSRAEAAEVAREALLLGPDDPAVLHNLGTIAEAQGHQEKAVAHYRKAVREAGGDPIPMTSWRLGHLLLKLDRPNEALTAFTAAAAHVERWTWPDSTRWWPAYEVGKLYARGKSYKTAVGWFEDALREALTANATREIRSWLLFARAHQPK